MRAYSFELIAIIEFKNGIAAIIVVFKKIFQMVHLIIWWDIKLLIVSRIFVFHLMDYSNEILIRLHMTFVDSVIFILHNRYHIFSEKLSLIVDFTYKNVILTLCLGINHANTWNYLLLLFQFIFISFDNFSHLFEILIVLLNPIRLNAILLNCFH